MPSFVQREVEAYLRCGTLEHGLLRLGCPACGFERLNPHPHTLALDGVYVRGDDGELAFSPLAAPSAEEVADVARRTAARVRQLFEQRAEEQDEAEPTGWTVCCAASASGGRSGGRSRGRRWLGGRRR